MNACVVDRGQCPVSPSVVLYFLIVCVGGEWEMPVMVWACGSQRTAYVIQFSLLYGSEESLSLGSRLLPFLRQDLPPNLELSVFARLVGQ